VRLAVGVSAYALWISTLPAVFKLQHKKSFERENPQTPKNAAAADGFALPDFLKLLLVLTHGRRGG
jgi:hypothetical protein